MRAARSWFVITAGLVLASAPGIGRAQGRGPGEARDLLTPYGEYLLLGGGVTEFSKDAVKDRFDTGGTWDVRLGFGSRYYVGAEAAYVGAGLNASGPGADLRMNGLEGVVRVQYPYFGSSGWLVEPFAFGGIGWSRVSLRNAAPGLKDGGDIGVVPFGAGVTLGYDRFLLDARFTYRPSFGEDLALDASQGTASLDRWAVGASIGYEF